MTTTAVRSGSGRAGWLPRSGHPDRCGRRVPCWRGACLARFAPYQTIEITRDRVIAWCHTGTYQLDDLAVRDVVAST